jgi:short-subunit dehydrogenase
MVLQPSGPDPRTVIDASACLRALQMDASLKGCFVYTSSASAVLPSPFAVSYASTKAFLSMFAISLAPEVKWLGIDVLAVHPSPVASR